MEVLSSIMFQSLKYILNIREKERNNNIVKQLFLIPKKWNDDNYKNIKYSKRFLQRFTEIFLILWNIIFHKNSYISPFSPIFKSKFLEAVYYNTQNRLSLFDGDVSINESSMRHSYWINFHWLFVNLFAVTCTRLGIN